MAVEKLKTKTRTGAPLITIAAVDYTPAKKPAAKEPPRHAPAPRAEVFPAMETQPPAVIKVVGVGGGGGNAVNRMIAAGLGGVEFIAVNSDLQALSRNRAPLKVQIGEKLTKGLGAGADPEIGRAAALEDTQRLIELLQGSDMVFVTTGLGGGTGTGAAPVIAGLASELGALVVAVVTKPFNFEGRRRRAQADRGLADLKSRVDTVIAIPNEKLLHTVEPGTSFTDACLMADDILRQAVQGISDLITIHGEINLDFADVRTIMSGMGMALMGTGIATGEHRAVEAAQRAVSSPLLEDTSIEGAKGVLINITGGVDMTLHEVSEASTIIQKSADPEANIIFGTVLDPTMTDRVKVTVIATGFRRDDGYQAAALEQSARTPEAPLFGGAGQEAAKPPAEEEGKRRFWRGPRWAPEAMPEFDNGGGFGPNARPGRDLDVPTFLRKQMD